MFQSNIIIPLRRHQSGGENASCHCVEISQQRKFFSFYFSHSEQVLGPTRNPTVSKPSVLQICTSTVPHLELHACDICRNHKLLLLLLPWVSLRFSWTVYALKHRVFYKRNTLISRSLKFGKKLFHRLTKPIEFSGTFLDCPEYLWQKPPVPAIT